MSASIEIKIAPTYEAPVKLIKMVTPKNIAELVKCECYANVGFFFDGTNNNYDLDRPGFGDSNIARLFDSYRNDPGHGYIGTYLPGVGTPFPEIAEFGHSDLGTGFGIGCEARVLYAMLLLFNSIHRIAFKGGVYFSKKQIYTLCSVKKTGRASVEALAILRGLGLQSPLLMPDFFGASARDDFFRSHSRILAKKISDNEKPVIKECFIDIFGFSRGAAEARVFCSWLERLLVDRKFAGIPVRFRFLGLMDTVASGGFWSSVVASLTKVTDGHSGWAAVEYLRLQDNIENCIHMVAMHELRKNFPLDEAGLNGALPPNTQEIAYPGAHSDIGGGYRPAELGISTGKSILESDALKISQIPLNHMLDCAIAAGAPMDRKRAASNIGFDLFATSPTVLKAYNDFLRESTMKARYIKDWMQPYLNWRWQNRLKYEELSHVKRCTEEERKILVKFNKILISDAKLIERFAERGKIKRVIGSLFKSSYKADEVSYYWLDDEAPSVLKEAKKSAKVSPTIGKFFDTYVHDSLAGFNKPKLESAGYWRYRKGFAGGEIGGIVFNEENSKDTALT